MRLSAACTVAVLAIAINLTLTSCTHIAAAGEVEAAQAGNGVESLKKHRQSGNDSSSTADASPHLRGSDKHKRSGADVIEHPPKKPR